MSLLPPFRPCSLEPNEIAAPWGGHQSGLPHQVALQSTQATFGGLLMSPAAFEKMTKSRERGLETACEFELDLGRQIAAPCRQVDWGKDVSATGWNCAHFPRVTSFIAGVLRRYRTVRPAPVALYPTHALTASRRPRKMRWSLACSAYADEGYTPLVDAGRLF